VTPFFAAACERLRSFIRGNAAGNALRHEYNATRKILRNFVAAV
jgi:hypothetical protein